MVKIFRKVHFWKDHRTFLELEGGAPEIIKGYPREGSVVVKIGEQNSLKSAFKLDVDEARCMRDQLNIFLEKHDIRFAKLLNNTGMDERPEYTSYNRAPQQQSQPDVFQDPSVQKPFFLFSEENEPRREKQGEARDEEKDEAEFYF